MSNANQFKLKNTKSAGCCGNCACGVCSCGCEKNACSCEERNCQCGCGKRVGRS
jgi:hypothetical protein